jgi:hypothetical protein
MNDKDFLTLAMRYQDGVLTPDEVAALEAAMRDDPAKRQLFADTQLNAMALHDRFRREAFQRDTDTPLDGSMRTRRSVGFTWITRPFAALAAGLAIGLFSASILWAAASPRATAERLLSLINGTFDEARLGHGFPCQIGFWSGDESAITEGRLRFIKPEGDSGDPDGKAIACDVFQLVDLRSLRHSHASSGDAVLELSARFADERPHNTNPSVTFFCQLYLFQGDPTQIYQSWPRSLSDALASGSAQVTTLGTDANGPRSLTAKCLLPAEADFAVIQIAARPNLRPAKLEGLFADDVKLTLKTQPQLPVRIVQR